MSQYSFYLKKKAIRENSEFIIFCNDHNGLELDKIFGIDCKHGFKKKVLYLIFRILLTEKLPFLLYPFKLFLRLAGFKIIRENFKYNYNSSFLASESGINFYVGGWHSELYFASETNRIFRNFNFGKPILNESNIEILKLITDTNSVSLHVRRGDFLDSNNLNLFGRICSLDYYNKSIKQIEKHISSPHFFVFSNDMEWVKSNIFLENVTYVEGNYGTNSWLDLYLMSCCKNNIIANSSFSWWGAWLNKNPNKFVICPSKFSNLDINSDVYPVNWIKI